jgi:ubiquinone/menaquinone biosynthesis C-methylase UbiE
VAAEVKHPLFARLYSRLVDPAEAGEHRDQLLAGIVGRVIEVGAGDGRNLGHYPQEVTEVLAVEPEPYLRTRAEKAAAAAAVPVTVVDGVADRLPAEDESFDAGVVSLVLCSVPDQPRALAELRRVIRPGGELRFYEHVLSPKPRMARVQRLLDRTFYPRLAGGCHCARDTAGGIEAAGFEIETIDRFPFNPTPFPGEGFPHILGVARRAAA